MTTNQETTMTTYLILRHGSNAANQSMRQTMPVAIVEAKSRRLAVEACDVNTYNNQRLEALPVSKAPAALVREYQEQEALSAAWAVTEGA